MRAASRIEAGPVDSNGADEIDDEIDRERQTLQYPVARSIYSERPLSSRRSQESSDASELGR